MSRPSLLLCNPLLVVHWYADYPPWVYQATGVPLHVPGCCWVCCDLTLFEPRRNCPTPLKTLIIYSNETHIWRHYDVITMLNHLYWGKNCKFYIPVTTLAIEFVHISSKFLCYIEPKLLKSWKNLDFLWRFKNKFLKNDLLFLKKIMKTSNL